MHLVGFLIFLVVIGLLMETAKKRGEFGFTTTKEEQRRLNRRGLTMMALLWLPVGGMFCALLDWAAGGIPERNQLVVYGFTMVAAGIPAGLLAAGMNGFLERFEGTRIQAKDLKKGH